MSEDTTIRIKKKVKEKPIDPDFAKRHADNEIVEYLGNTFGGLCKLDPKNGGLKI
jgi:hypothetical protein